MSRTHHFTCVWISDVFTLYIGKKDINTRVLLIGQQILVWCKRNSVVENITDEVGSDIKEQIQCHGILLTRE